MKSIKITFLPLFIFCMITSTGFGQMVGGNAFLMGINQEIGINPLGFEGTTTGSIPAPFLLIIEDLHPV